MLLQSTSSAYQSEFLVVVKFFDAFLSSHSLGSGAKFLDIDYFLGSMHLRVFCASTV